VLTAPEAERRRVLAEQRRQLASAELAPAFTEPALNRTAHRAMKIMARAARQPMARFFGWWPRWQIGSRGYSGWQLVAIVVVVFTLSAARQCSPDAETRARLVPLEQRQR